MEKQAEIELRPEDRGDDYDAIVLGSGYGGSVAACRMSRARIRVCLLEKGRRWKAEDFPTDSWKIMSAVRYVNQNLGLRFGPEDDLFQLYEQNDSLAAVACGLGGGSLVNAGVMLPTPIRARRNLKWPKEWERDWDICESSAASMPRIQSSSVKFPIAKVMGEIAEGELEANIESSVKISMAILGKNKILPLLGKSKGSSGHRLLKYIALYLPRYERCTCKECEVLSGIFGNAFWLNTQSATKLPMSAFPHLRRICNSGYIVDSNGNNSFLIHPERMAISTLYISGGRSLLVTPEISYLANKYMKLHQPGFRHERAVVDGFGHSDLLIGEKSHEKVFPHILSHIRLAEQEGNDLTPRKRYNKEALDWGDDPYREYGDFGCWFFALAIIFFFLLLHVLFW